MSKLFDAIRDVLRRAEEIEEESIKQHALIEADINDQLDEIEHEIYLSSLLSNLIEGYEEN